MMWKNILGYNGLYQISDNGQVMSFISNRILKQNLNNGYYSVRLKDKLIKIHKLVAIHFMENYKYNVPNIVINHINGIKTDNRIENLEQITKSENTYHAHKLGLIKKAKNKIELIEDTITQISSDSEFKNIIYKNIIFPAHFISSTGIVKRIDGFIYKITDKKFVEIYYLKRYKMSINEILKYTYLEHDIIENIDGENWNNIDGYINYQVSNFGRIKSNNYNNTAKSKLLKQRLCNGYYTITLYKSNKPKTYKVHRLVLENFTKNLDIDKTHINHVNGIKTDNRLINLEYVTPSYNTLHAYSNNLIIQKQGENHHLSKLTNIDVINIYNMKNVKANDIAKMYNIHKTTVFKIKAKKIWKELLNKL